MTLTALYLEIPGPPIPLKRPRFAVKRWQMSKVVDKAIFRSWCYNCQEKEMFAIKNLMKSQYRGPPIDEPLMVFYEFNMSIPKCWSKSCTEKALNNKIFPRGRPDISNVIKFYEDCMNNVIFIDDSLIIKTEAIKVYSKEPKTRIWVRSMSEKQIQNSIEEKLHVA